MNYTVKVTGAKEIHRDLVASRKLMEQRAHPTFKKNVLRLQSLTQRRAPVETGEYRDSIRVEYRLAGTAWSAEVGSDLDRGYRLEFGFVGVDDEGNMINQAPRPHFRPAVDIVEKEMVVDFLKLVMT